jgi:mono/diheme cytochrome c family protein
VHESWDAIVLGGALAGNGMASFADVLSADDARDVHAYVISEAVASTGWGRRLLQAAAGLVCRPAEWLAD